MVERGGVLRGRGGLSVVTKSCKLSWLGHKTEMSCGGFDVTH